MKQALLESPEEQFVQLRVEKKLKALDSKRKKLETKEHLKKDLILRVWMPPEFVSLWELDESHRITEEKLLEIMRVNKSETMPKNFCRKNTISAQGAEAAVHPATSPSPLVWRRIRVSACVNLDDFEEHVLKPALGWSRNYHSCGFLDQTDGSVFAPSNTDAIDHMHVPMHAVKVIDLAHVELGLLLSKVGDRLLYIYDWGDFFMHVIELEAVVESESTSCDDSEGAARLQKHTGLYFGAHVLDGQMRCPPEDSNGLRMCVEKPGLTGDTSYIGCKGNLGYTKLVRQLPPEKHWRGGSGGKGDRNNGAWMKPPAHVIRQHLSDGVPCDFDDDWLKYGPKTVKDIDHQLDECKTAQNFRDSSKLLDASKKRYKRNKTALRQQPYLGGTCCHFFNPYDFSAQLCDQHVQNILKHLGKTRAAEVQGDNSEGSISSTSRDSTSTGRFRECRKFNNLMLPGSSSGVSISHFGVHSELDVVMACGTNDGNKNKESSSKSSSKSSGVQGPTWQQDPTAFFKLSIGEMQRRFRKVGADATISVHGKPVESDAEDPCSDSEADSDTGSQKPEKDNFAAREDWKARDERFGHYPSTRRRIPKLVYLATFDVDNMRKRGYGVHSCPLGVHFVLKIAQYEDDFVVLDLKFRYKNWTVLKNESMRTASCADSEANSGFFSAESEAARSENGQVSPRGFLVEPLD